MCSGEGQGLDARGKWTYSSCNFHTRSCKGLQFSLTPQQRMEACNATPALQHP